RCELTRGQVLTLELQVLVFQLPSPLATQGQLDATAANPAEAGRRTRDIGEGADGIRGVDAIADVAPGETAGHIQQGAEIVHSRAGTQSSEEIDLVVARDGEDIGGEQGRSVAVGHDAGTLRVGLNAKHPVTGCDPVVADLATGKAALHVQLAKVSGK